MTNIADNIATRVRNEVHSNPISREQVKNRAMIAQIISVAALVMSLAYTLIGTAFCASGSIFGAVLVISAVTIGYLSYNLYKVAHNIEKLCKNAFSYMRHFGLNPINKPDLISLLSKETLLFDWGVELGVEFFDKIKKP